MQLNKFLRVVGVMLIIMGLLSYDLDNYAYYFNKKSWLKIIVGLIFLLIYFNRKSIYNLKDKIKE